MKKYIILIFTFSSLILNNILHLYYNIMFKKSIFWWFFFLSNPFKYS